jgi:Flp pilus assembly protein TadG
MLAANRTHGRKRRGAHLVEFALVAPMFFLFVLTIIDIGRGMMATSLLNNAARAGCRTGVLPGKANSDIQTAVTQTLNGQGMSSGTTLTVTVNGAVADASTANTKDLIAVSLSTPVANVTWLPAALFVKGTLTGQYSLERE